MNQPELGKKISELRKAKGLTQEELVEKCNISVRTLQRIEAGEVIPRAYTIKIIFAALDYNDSYKITTNINWLEQFYEYFIDLFNLKTNKMKKITILSIMLTLVLAIVLLISVNGNTPKEEKSNLKTLNSDVKVTGTFNGWDESDVFAGRDVTCTINGVYFNVSIMTLDKKTREFHAFVRGKLLNNRIEVYTNNELIECLTYEAQDIVKTNTKIELKGKARITYNCGSDKNSIIEASEISIMLNN